MLKLRKFLCGCFGFLALLFVMVSFGTVSHHLHSSNEPGFNSVWPNRTPLDKIFSLFMLLLSKLILAMPPVLGFLYGMACWTIRQGKASGRRWAIAASLGMLVLSVPLLVASCLIVVYSPRMAMGFLIFVGLVLAAGIAGLVAFARRDSMPQPVFAAKPLRIAGDGTSRLLDGVAWLIGIGGYIGGRYLWVHWAHAHGLSPDRGSSSLVLIVAALLLTVFLHESGHAITGLALGMRLRAFIVGPFQWRIRDGRWKFKFILAQLFSAGGATAVVPTDPGNLVGARYA